MGPFEAGLCERVAQPVVNADALAADRQDMCEMRPPPGCPRSFPPPLRAAVAVELCPDARQPARRASPAKRHRCEPVCPVRKRAPEHDLTKGCPACGTRSRRETEQPVDLPEPPGEEPVGGEVGRQAEELVAALPVEHGGDAFTPGKRE